MPFNNSENSDQPERLTTFFDIRFGNLIQINNPLSMSDPLIKSAIQDGITSGVRHAGGQMRALRNGIAVVIVLSMTYIFTRLWLDSAWSERFWTWLNTHLSMGVSPGLASDLELIVVLIGVFALSFCLIRILFKAWRVKTKPG